MHPEMFEEILDKISRINIDILPISDLGEKVISLYNWGEPTLNPRLSDILKISIQNGFIPDISTNASFFVDIPSDIIKDARSWIFSVPGVSQESYDKMHGFKADAVFNNIKAYCDKIKDASKGQKSRLLMAFHIYRFNMYEIELAEKFCIENGIKIIPYYANFDDFDMSYAYLTNRLDNNILAQAKDQLVLSYVDELVSKMPSNYECPQFNRLVINEVGKVVLCCGTNIELGDFLEMSLEDIENARKSQDICDRCVKSGNTWWGHNSLSYNPILEHSSGLKGLRSEKEHVSLRKNANNDDIKCVTFGLTETNAAVRKLDFINEKRVAANFDNNKSKCGGGVAWDKDLPARKPE
jgi:MoaA/NifB/PqqE/SkfB family radical SAM enzyme